MEGDSMTDLTDADWAKLAPLAPADLTPAPSVVPTELSDLSDDECLTRLARAIAMHDSEHLDEVARLIGRLAVTIE
jgi:hypothetical protein